MTAYQPYECKESIKTEDGVKYFFVSKGKKHIVKAIHYMYTGKIGHQRIFNLGFGDYLLEKDSIDDKVTTDNGDVYRVVIAIMTSINIAKRLVRKNATPFAKINIAESMLIVNI
eukprot:gene10803-13226_t